MTKKRVLMTLEKEPYEALQAKAKENGFHPAWFSREIDKMILGLNEIIDDLVTVRNQGKEKTDKECTKLIVATAEKVFGTKVTEIFGKK